MHAMPDAKTRIVTTAEGLFYSEGIQAVGVDRIIAESGVAKATFYRHFPSKESLVLGCLRRRHVAWISWLDEAVARLSPDPAGRALAVFDALRERFAERGYRGCAFINTIVEVADPTHAAHQVAVEHKEVLRRRVASYLRAAGVEDRVEDVARDFVMLIDGAIVASVREGNPGAATRAKAIARLLIPGSAALLPL